MKVSWNGVYPAATTQFTEDGGLDLEATARHLNYMIEAGVSGLILLGSLGRTPPLTMTRS